MMVRERLRAGPDDGGARRGPRARAGGTGGAQALIREARRRERRRRLWTALSGLAVVAGGTAGIIASAGGGGSPAVRAAFRTPMPQPLHGRALGDRTGLELLVAAEPPFVLNVDTGATRPIRGLSTRGNPVLSVLAVGKDAVVWLDHPGPSGTIPRAQIYVVPAGTTKAVRVATGWDVAPAADGHAIWVLGYRTAHTCTLSELGLAGHVLLGPRPANCTDQLGSSGSGPGPVIDPATGRAVRISGSLWSVDGRWALASTPHEGSTGPGAPLTLTDMVTGRSRRVPWPSRIGFTDQAVTGPGDRSMALEFADPAYEETATQVMDTWLFDPATRRFEHVPDMPASVHLKFTSMAWASNGRLVILAQSGGPQGDRNVVAVWGPGHSQIAVRAVRLPARASGSDSFVVW